MSHYHNLLIDDQDGICLITINRPEKLNALNKDTIQELSRAIEEADSAVSVRVIVITGSGNKAFIAGADISEFAHFSQEQGQALATQGQADLFDRVANCSTPVIAAINGYALGGGLELAMAAHMRIASDDAKMGLPEVSLGVIPGYGGTQRLPELVGKGRALELICSAGMIEAQHACAIGLVNSVVPADELLPTTMKLAQKIKRNAPIAIAHAIASVSAGSHPKKDGYAHEKMAFGACFATADFKEGTSAFLEKRKANFKGA